MDDTSIETAELVRSLVHLANENNERMTGQMNEIYQIIRNADVVFAIWQDFAKPFGVSILLIKGVALLRGCASGDKAIQPRVSAISCRCCEQAIALQQICGEPDLRH